ncbi:MAG: hypothetical protein I3273_04095 [Candidatus Moeniiplasma glomeromycotorum]|nr:hypothetical protein [Candidatus Moeniiplasma glomeromycotorum]
MTDRKIKTEEIKKRLIQNNTQIISLKAELNAKEAENAELEKKLKELEEEDKKKQEKIDEQEKKLKETENEDAEIDKLLDEALNEADKFDAHMVEIRNMDLFKKK